jgi:hypothetical protein
MVFGRKDFGHFRDRSLESLRYPKEILNIFGNLLIKEFGKQSIIFANQIIT